MSRKRIGVAFTDEFGGAELREAFDVAAHAHEVAEAGEQFDHALRPRGPIEFTMAGRKAQLRDLAGAAADDEMQRRFVIDEDGFEIDALGGIAGEGPQPLFGEDGVDQMLDAAAGGLDALPHRVVRKKPAQDDPEPCHGRHYAAR